MQLALHRDGWPGIAWLPSGPKAKAASLAGGAGLPLAAQLLGSNR